MTELAESARCDRGLSGSWEEPLDRFGFAILEARGNETVQLDDVMALLGTPVEYQFGAKLAIEPQRDSRNSQFSSRAMPLHTDAVLNADDVSIIGMECHEAPAAGGETLVASTEAFFRLAPPELLDTLRGIVIEYRSRVGGYYKADAAGEYPSAAPVRIDPTSGRETLYLALDDPKDETRNYSAAVRGYSDGASAKLLRQVDEQLRRPEILYAHQWRVGDILLLDNRRVMHGRASFAEGVRRKLVRLSVA